MRFQGAVITEQGITFAIAIVKPHVVQSPSEAQKTQIAFQPIFPGVPVILMAQNARGVPTYFGRSDIVKFLASLAVEQIPWREYNYG